MRGLQGKHSFQERQVSVRAERRSLPGEGGGRAGDYGNGMLWISASVEGFCELRGRRCAEFHGNQGEKTEGYLRVWCVYAHVCAVCVCAWDIDKDKNHSEMRPGELKVVGSNKALGAGRTGWQGLFLSQASRVRRSGEMGSPSLGAGLNLGLRAEDVW